MKKNMFKVMALSLAMATLSTTAAFAAGWGKVGSEWYYYQEDGTVARNTWINTLVSIRCRIHTFQACSFSHSDTSPNCCSCLAGTGANLGKS